MHEGRTVRSADHGNIDVEEVLDEISCLLVDAHRHTRISLSRVPVPVDDELVTGSRQYDDDVLRISTLVIEGIAQLCMEIVRTQCIPDGRSVISVDAELQDAILPFEPNVVVRMLVFIEIHTSLPFHWPTPPRPTSLLQWRLVEVEEFRRVSVKDLLGVLLGQSAFLYVLEGPSIRLERQQSGKVAPRHDVVGAEGFASTPKSGLRAPSNAVVVETAGHRARRTEQVWRARLAVESRQLHRDEPAQMRDDDLDVREANRDVPLDQVENYCSILQRRPCRRREAVVSDEW